MQLTVTDFMFDILFLIDMVVRGARQHGDCARWRQATRANTQRPFMSRLESIP